MRRHLTGQHGMKEMEATRLMRPENLQVQVRNNKDFLDPQGLEEPLFGDPENQRDSRGHLQVGIKRRVENEARPAKKLCGDKKVLHLFRPSTATSKDDIKRRIRAAEEEQRRWAAEERRLRDKLHSIELEEQATRIQELQAELAMKHSRQQKPRGTDQGTITLLDSGFFKYRDIFSKLKEQ
jgi:hypothetical protein